MADVQVENGFTRIANELLDALTRFRIPGEQRQVFDVILRLSYGFHKPSCKQIFYSEFERRTGLKQGHIYRALRSLKEHNLIVRDKNEIRIEKDYEKWLTYSKSGVSKSGVEITPKVDKKPTPKTEYKRQGKPLDDKELQIPKEKNKENLKKEDRANLFAEKVYSNNGYQKEDLSAFIEYWTESGENQKKMRYEMEKVFDIDRRLKTWMRNKEKWESKKNKEAYVEEDY